MGSVIFTHAASDWKKMRDDYSGYLQHAYDAALEGTGGVLVNRLGRSLHIDGFNLFTGSRTYAYKYASEELVDWWKHHPRLSLEQYEQQWVQGHERYQYVG